jgi:hypothetical protein
MALSVFSSPLLVCCYFCVVLTDGQSGAVRLLLASWTFSLLLLPVVPDFVSDPLVQFIRSSCCSIPESRGLPRSHFVSSSLVLSGADHGTPVIFVHVNHTDGFVSSVGPSCCSCWMATMALSALVVVGDRTDGHHGTVRFTSASCGGYNSTATPVVQNLTDGHVDTVGYVVVDQ